MQCLRKKTTCLDEDLIMIYDFFLSQSPKASFKKNTHCCDKVLSWSSATLRSFSLRSGGHPTWTVIFFSFFFFIVLGTLNGFQNLVKQFFVHNPLKSLHNLTQSDIIRHEITQLTTHAAICNTQALAQLRSEAVTS